MLSVFISEMEIPFFIMLGAGAFLLLLVFRLPWSVHVWKNEMILKTYAILFTCVMGIALIVFYDRVTHNPANDGIWVTLGMVLYVSVGVGYIGYFGVPSLMEWKFKRKVKRTVERYRKGAQGNLPRESLGPDYDWMPRLVVDGKSYYWVNYSIKQRTTADANPAEYLKGLMGVDMEGEVVRDEALANKLNRCFTLAAKTCMPFQHQVRERDYWEVAQAEREIRRILAARKEIERSVTADLGPGAVADVEKMYQTLEILREGVEIRKEAILLEANYVMKHHHEYAKECRYEDLERLAAETRGIMAKVGRLSWEKYWEGDLADSRIEIAYYEKKECKMHPQLKKLGDLISVSSKEIREGIEGAQAEELTEEKKPIYAPMNGLEQRRWRERLRYVDLVDKLPAKNKRAERVRG
jgi:hypothetical protein